MYNFHGVDLVRSGFGKGRLESNERTKDIDRGDVYTYTRIQVDVEDVEDVEDKRTGRPWDVIICVRIVRLAGMAESFDISRSLIKLERIIAPRREGEPRSDVVVRRPATERRAPSRLTFRRRHLRRFALSPRRLRLRHPSGAGTASAHRAILRPSTALYLSYCEISSPLLPAEFYRRPTSRRLENSPFSTCTISASNIKEIVI